MVNDSSEKVKTNYSLIWRNPFVLRLAMTAGIGGFLFGYDTGVISGALLYIRDDFKSVDRNTNLQESIVSMTTGGAIIGAAIGGWYNDRFGRRISILSADVVFFFGAIVMASAPFPALIIVGRIMVGLGVGMASMASPLYISESSPAQVRGALVTLNGLLLTVGQFLSYLINYGLTKAPGTWRWMLGVSCLPALVQFFLMLFMPESPRWLYRKNRDEEAEAVLEKIFPADEVQNEIANMKQAIEIEKEERETFGKIEYKDLWNDIGIRRGLIAGVGIQLVQQFVGINTVLYYSPSIVQFAGFASNSTSLLLSLITSGLNVVGTIISMLLIDKTGRKKLLVFSLVGIIVSLALIGGIFRYTAKNTPPVSRQLTAQLFANTTCPTYNTASSKWDCTRCLKARPSCGFCSSQGKLLPGSCVVSNSKTKKSCQGMSGMWFVRGCPSKYGWVALIGLASYIISYAPGMGTIPWIVNAEIYPPKYSGLCGGIAATANWIGNLVVAQTFLTLVNAIGASMTFFLFGILAAVGLVFVLIAVPETKGLSFEKVRELMIKEKNKTKKKESTMTV